MAAWLCSWLSEGAHSVTAAHVYCADHQTFEEAQGHGHDHDGDRQAPTGVDPSNASSAPDDHEACAFFDGVPPLATRLETFVAVHAVAAHAPPACLAHQAASLPIPLLHLAPKASPPRAFV